MNKFLKSTITAILTIALATGIAYGVLSVTKPTSTITVRTANMDVTLGTPTIVNDYPLAPGQSLVVDVPVTNTNQFPISAGTVSLKNIAWYESDGTTPANVTGSLTISPNAYMYPSGGTSSSNITSLSNNATGIVKVIITLPSGSDSTTVGKNAKLTLDMTFNQAN